MRRVMQRVATVALICLFSTSAQAFYPVDGWWWNPEQPGTGLNIEMQDDVMNVAGYLYAPDGRSLWYLAAGPFDAERNRFTGRMDGYRGGQCLGCPFTSPTLQAGAGGQIRIDFDSAISATVTWAGGSFRLERYYWAFDDIFDVLLGEWHITENVAGVFFGEQLVMDNRGIVDGRMAVQGRRLGSNNRPALAIFEPPLLALLVDSAPSFFSFYLFDMTKDRMEGRSWTYRKDEELSGGGAPFIAHRVSSRAFVQTGSGPTRTFDPDQLPLAAASAADDEAALESLTGLRAERTTGAADPDSELSVQVTGEHDTTAAEAARLAARLRFAMWQLTD